jgi:hypothetical protein
MIRIAITLTLFVGAVQKDQPMRSVPRSEIPKTKNESGIACSCDGSDRGINERPNAKKRINARFYDKKY